MKNLIYIAAGTIFGLALTKGEAMSWFRIQEMFRFESFHMFGIFMTAIPTGALGLWWLKGKPSAAGVPIEPPTKVYHHGIIIGSLLFGFGWALTGACPGPLYTQVGSGVLVSAVTLLSAITGTYAYGRWQKYLPD